MSPELFLVLALPLLAAATPTHCDRWKGSSEFRCAKDHYGADSINIRNIANNSVSFRIGKWLSNCGWSGVNYANGDRQLGPLESNDEDFTAAEEGVCNEMFIYDCKLVGFSVNCIDVITPSVNYS